MAFGSYADLVQEIEDFLNRSDLNEKVPTFIRLAEARMQRELQAYSTRVSEYALALDYDTGRSVTFPPASVSWFSGGGTGVVSLDYVGLRVADAAAPDGAHTPLGRVSETELQQMRANNAARGKPRYFAVLGQSLAVWPMPDVPKDTSGADSAYEFVLTMTGPLKLFGVPLVDQTAFALNPLVAEHPDLYLYGALAAAAPYLQEDERLPMWEGLFAKVMRDIRIQHNRIVYGTSQRRQRLPVVFG